MNTHLSTDLLESLEARQLLASTFDNDTADGDFYRVKVTGPGAAVVNTTPGGADFDILSVTVNGTTTASKLEITVQKAASGDGRFVLKNLVINSPIGTVSAPKVDIAQDGQLTTQAVGSLTIGDLNPFTTATLGPTKSATFRDLLPLSNLTIGGDATAQTTLAGRNLGSDADGAIIAASGFIKKFTANSFFGSATLNAGFGDLILTQNSSIELITANGAPTVHSIVCKGELQISADIASAVTTLSAASLNLDVLIRGDARSVKSTAGGIAGGLSVNGRLTAISAKTSIASGVFAQNYGAISAGSFIGGAFSYGNPAPSGYVIESFKTPLVQNTQLANGNLLVGAQRIKSIDVGSWTGGSIQADGIDAIKAKTDFAPNTVDLSNGVTQAFSIKSITVGGNLRGTFTLASDLLALKAASAGTPQESLKILDGNNLPVDVGSVKLTGPLTSNIEINAQTLSSIDLKGGGTLQFTLAGTLPGNLAIKSITGGNLTVFGGTNQAFGIGSINVKQLDVGLSTGSIGSLKVTGGSGLPGDFSGYLQSFAAAANGLYVTSVDIKGTFHDGEFKVLGPIGSFAAGGMNNAVVASGYSGQANELPTTLNNYSNDPFSRIGSFKLRRAFNNAAPAFVNANVIARHIDKIAIAGAIATNNAGTPFGFGAQTYGTVDLKDATGGAIGGNGPTSPGDFSPFPNSADFNFRVFA